MREIHRIVVSGATVIDGTGGAPLANASVLVEGDRIVGVGSRDGLPIPQGATVLDGRGKFVIPGLVDMHVHVYTPEKWHPEFFLAAGVTTVLDLGGQLHDVTAHRTAIESGARPGPRMLFTGPMLEEGEVYAGFAGFCRRFDATNTEAEIDALADAGVDGIKLYVTVRPDTTRRACARAHARGLPVFMHQHATWGAEAALAGVDSVEHVNVFGQLAPQGFWLAEPGKLNPFEYGGWLWRWLDELDPRSDAVRRLYDALIAAGTALDPTLVLYAARPGALGDDVGNTSMDDPERTTILPRLPRAVGDELVRRWTERREAARGASEAAKHRMRRAWNNILTLVGGFHRAGGTVLAGTDCPNVAIVSGFSLHRELELLVRAGLSPMEAILSATRRPAERLGRRDLFGTIAPGRAADLLLLNADPLADIRNVARIERVVARGVVYETDRLLRGQEPGRRNSTAGD
ncbi:MAG TPA: amidohydrolase family protein [Methylomirabilota bacterium]|nr:amidohydrolase family protein [Methylomirabilota bacterium]